MSLSTPKLGPLFKLLTILKINVIDFYKNVNQSFKEKVQGNGDLLGLIIRLFEIFKIYKSDNQVIEKKIKKMLMLDGFNKTEVEESLNELKVNYSHLI